MQTLDSAIAELRSILDSNPLAPITEANAAVAASPEHWSRKQILGHLIDSAANNHHRFVRAQIEDQLDMPGYAQEAWVRANHYQDRPWSDLAAPWKSYNLHLAHIMEETPVDRLQAPCRIGDQKPVTLEFLMVDYVDHMKHHLQQMLGR